MRFKVTPGIQEKRAKIKECLATSLQESSGSGAVSPPDNNNAQFSHMTSSAMNVGSNLFSSVPERVRHSKDVIESSDPPSIANTEERDMDDDEMERSHRHDIKPIIAPVITLDSEDSCGSEETLTAGDGREQKQKAAENSMSDFHLNKEHNPSSSAVDILNCR